MKGRLDIHEYDELLAKALRYVKKSKISRKNKEAIIKFHHYCFAEGLSKARIVRFLQILPKVALLLGKDFEKAGKEDIW
jgi:hypothetical protein